MILPIVQLKYLHWTLNATFSQLSDTISRNSRLIIVLHSFCYKAICFRKSAIQFSKSVPL